MGGSSSRMMPYVEANTHFDMNEVGKLAGRYQVVKQEGNCATGNATTEAFTNHFLGMGMSLVLAEGFAQAFQSGSPDPNGISFEEFVIGLARSSKAPVVHRNRFCFDLFKNPGKDCVSKSRFHELLPHLLAYAFLKIQVKLFPEEPEEMKQTIDGIFVCFGNPAEVRNKDPALSFEGFDKWLTVNSEIGDTIRYLMELEYVKKPSVPLSLVAKQVAVPPTLVGKSIILREEDWVEIRSNLNKDLREHALVLLYSSSNDGFSLATLYRKFLGKSRYIDPNPSLIVVRDTEGHVFGGFCSSPWRKITRDEFYGDDLCYLFSIRPKAAVYKHRATSKDVNYMYSSPHIIAMGGKKGGYGLSLDEDLFEGTSYYNGTFGSKSLSSTPNFRIQTVELWGFINPDENLELLLADIKRKMEKESKSCLDDKKNTFILELIGRGQSANVRDTD